MVLHNVEETRILGFIITDSEFNFSAKLFGHHIELKEFSHLLIHRNKLTYKTELDNCIAHLRNMSVEHVQVHVSPFKKASRLLEEVKTDDVLIEFIIKEHLVLTLVFVLAISVDNLFINRKLHTKSCELRVGLLLITLFTW